MNWIKGGGRFWDAKQTHERAHRGFISLGARIFGTAACLAILFTGSLATAQTRAQQPKRCHAPPTVENKMITDNPSAKVAIRLLGNRAQTFIDVLNRLEPVTDHKTDMVLIFSKPKAKSYFVMVFRGGCLSFGSDIQSRQFRRLWPRITVEGVSI